MWVGDWFVALIRGAVSLFVVLLILTGDSWLICGVLFAGLLFTGFGFVLLFAGY